MSDIIIQLTPTLWIVCTKNELSLNEYKYAELLYEKNKASNIPRFCIMFIKNLSNENISFDHHLVILDDDNTELIPLSEYININYDPSRVMELKITYLPKDITNINDIKYSFNLIKTNKLYESLLDKYKNIISNGLPFSVKHKFSK